MNKITQTFCAKFPEVEAFEVAVLDTAGHPTESHGFVLTGTGQIIDSETFLMLYGQAASKPADPALNSALVRKVQEREAVKRFGREFEAARQTDAETPTVTLLDSSGTPQADVPKTICGWILAALKDGPKVYGA